MKITRWLPISMPAALAVLTLAVAACGGPDESSELVPVEESDADMSYDVSEQGLQKRPTAWFAKEECTCSGYTGCSDQTDKDDCELLGCTWTCEEKSGGDLGL